MCAAALVRIRRARYTLKGEGRPPPTLHPDRAEHANTTASGASQQQASRFPPASGPPSQASQLETQYHENPARLALINKDQPRDRYKEEFREDRDPREDRAAPNQRPNDSRTAPSDAQRDSQVQQPDEAAPTGPRRHRSSRDLSAGVPSESSYGRLNGPQDVPLGPRPPNGPSGRSGRTFPGSISQPVARPNEAPLPSPTSARPPETPAALRSHGLRQAPDRRHSGIERPPSSSNSVPTTPATENGPAVHPSRMNQVDMQPPPIQTSMPPSGPRGSGRPSAGGSAGPSPSGPPSGPASAVERQRRGERRQITNINATLQGPAGTGSPNGQGVSFRGAAQNRPQNAQGSSTTSAQPVQAIASAIEIPARRDESGFDRQEAGANRSEVFHDPQGSSIESDTRGAARGRRSDEEHPERHQSSLTYSQQPSQDTPTPISAALSPSSRTPTRRRKYAHQKLPSSRSLYS